MRSLTDSYSSIFLVFAAADFDEQLWGFCALALGWVVFAILVILILSYQRGQRGTSARCPACVPAGFVEEEFDRELPLHGPPVWRVLLFIRHWGQSMVGSPTLALSPGLRCPFFYPGHTRATLCRCSATDDASSDGRRLCGMLLGLHATISLFRSLALS